MPPPLIRSGRQALQALLCAGMPSHTCGPAAPSHTCGPAPGHRCSLKAGQDRAAWVAGAAGRRPVRRGVARAAVVAASVTECAVVTHEQWASLVQQEPHWDAHKVGREPSTPKPETRDPKPKPQASNPTPPCQVCSFLEDLPIFGTLDRSELMKLARLVRSLSLPAEAVSRCTEGQGHGASPHFIHSFSIMSYS